MWNMFSYVQFSVVSRVLHYISNHTPTIAMSRIMPPKTDIKQHLDMARNQVMLCRTSAQMEWIREDPREEAGVVLKRLREHPAVCVLDDVLNRLEWIEDRLEELEPATTEES